MSPKTCVVPYCLCVLFEPVENDQLSDRPVDLTGFFKRLEREMKRVPTDGERLGRGA